MKARPILPPTFLLIAVIAILLLNFAIPLGRLIPTPWNLFGLLPLAFGLALNFVADNAFQKAGTTVKPFQESTTLLTDGVYRLSRNPMYLGFVLILAGVVILLGSLSPWVILPIFAGLMQVMFIQAEERMLEEQFGPDWLAYKRQVRQWL
ncbi:MAG: isoprenylcysteine carboxylmethyltransferase family protein [Chloroflexota bacterium]